MTSFSIALIQTITVPPPDDEQKWQRPELYDRFYPKPLRDAAE